MKAFLIGHFYENNANRWIFAVIFFCSENSKSDFMYIGQNLSL